MDPLGFALEHFDLDGRWRALDGAAAIDSSGKLVDGTRLDGVGDLRKALLARSDSFVTSVIERLLTYALGRRVEYYDEPAIRTILRDAKQDNYRFSSILLGIVKSVPFRMQGGISKPVGDTREANLDDPHREQSPLKNPRRRLSWFPVAPCCAQEASSA